MTSILEKKKQKLAELEVEMNRLGYDLGLENGSGEWDMADRFAEDKETELDLKRIDHVGLMGNVQLMKLSKERLDLLRDIARMEGREDPFGL